MKMLISVLWLALASPPGAVVAQTQPASGPAPQAPSLESKQLLEDAKLTTASGATFTVTRGWHVARTADIIVIQEPEGELAAAFVEVAAPTVEEAIAQAWKRWKPEFARAVRLTTKPPPTEGWDEVAQIAYETGAEERRVVAGAARRKGATYYVTLIDGAIAAAQRRGAQLNTSVGSLEVAGREEENLAGRRAHTLDPPRAEKLLAFAEDARTLTKVPGRRAGRRPERQDCAREGPRCSRARPDRAGHARDAVHDRLHDQAAHVALDGTAGRSPEVRLGHTRHEATALFALGDPDATARVTMAHTVCACTGLPRWDMEFLFEWQKATAASRIELLRVMKPTTGFGETFQYSNLMVASGGYVAALTATSTKDPRRAYVDAMAAEVLGPLGMTSTALALDEAQRREHARPHARTLVFDVEPIPTDVERGVDSVMPAGGAWSNVRDISRWLLLELGQGDGRQVISETSVLERRKPRVKISAKQSSGLALFIDESRGRKAIGHGGNTFGFSADATFFPEHDLGLVVLTNAAAANAFAGAVRRKLVELLFDANEEAEKALAFNIKQLGEAIKKQLEEISLNPEPAFVEPLMGTWTNPRLGAIEIHREGSGFTLDAGEWRAPIGEHKDQSGARKIILTGPPFGFAFWPQPTEGRPALLFETAQQKYWFERPPGTAR